MATQHTFSRLGTRHPRALYQPISRAKSTSEEDLERIAKLQAFHAIIAIIFNDFLERKYITCFELLPTYTGGGGDHESRISKLLLRFRFQQIWKNRVGPTPNTKKVQQPYAQTAVTPIEPDLWSNAKQKYNIKEDNEWTTFIVTLKDYKTELEGCFKAIMSQSQNQNSQQKEGMKDLLSDMAVYFSSSACNPSDKCLEIKENIVSLAIHYFLPSDMQTLIMNNAFRTGNNNGSFYGINPSTRKAFAKYDTSVKDAILIMYNFDRESINRHCQQECFLEPDQMHNINKTFQHSPDDDEKMKTRLINLHKKLQSLPDRNSPEWQAAITNYRNSEISIRSDLQPLFTNLGPIDNKFKINTAIWVVNANEKKTLMELESTLNKVLTVGLVAALINNDIGTQGDFLPNNGYACLFEYEEVYGLDMNSIELRVLKLQSGGYLLGLYYHPWYYTLLQIIEGDWSNPKLTNFHGVWAFTTISKEAITNHSTKQVNIFEIVYGMLNAVTDPDIDTPSYCKLAVQTGAYPPILKKVQNNKLSEYFDKKVVIRERSGDFSLSDNTNVPANANATRVKIKGESPNVKEMYKETWAEFRKLLITQSNGSRRLGQGGDDGVIQYRVQYRKEPSQAMMWAAFIQDGGCRTCSSLHKYIKLRADMKKSGNEAKRRRIYIDLVTKTRYIRMGGERVDLSTLKGRYIMA